MQTAVLPDTGCKFHFFGKLIFLVDFNDNITQYIASIARTPDPITVQYILPSLGYFHIFCYDDRYNDITST